MAEADVRMLLAQKKLREVAPDPETARAEIELARRHIASAETSMASDSTLAFTALYDAIRKAISAHMRAHGYRVSARRLALAPPRRLEVAPPAVGFSVF